MQRIKLPKIQEFFLTLTLKSPILTLEIEEESSRRAFSLDLNEASVNKATDGFFETLEDLFEGLKSAANGTSPEINLILSKEELTYIGSYSQGKARLEHRFTLKLTEKRMDQLEALEKKFQLLEQWKEKYEAEVKKCQENSQVLKEENEKMAQRVEELEKSYENLQASVLFTPDIYFNNKSVNIFHFNLIDSNKTAISVRDNSQRLEILPQIPLRGRHCYSLRINKKQLVISFGITTEISETKEVDSPTSSSKSYYGYCTINGKILGRIEQKATGNGPFGNKNSIIKMVVDMEKGILTFFVDNWQVNSCPISKSDKYFAYIRFTNAGDSVTLL